MTVTEQIDGVVVAGAGPVGLVTALKIAKSGVPVVVLDGREDVIREPRAIVYHPPTVEVLDSLGLLDEIKQIGVVKTSEALEYAQQRDLDLGEVAPDARPPVCRVLD